MLILSSYVICVELFNVIAPSDRLFFVQSKSSDLFSILSKRLNHSLLLVPACYLFVSYFSHLDVFESALFAILCFMNALAICLSSFYLGRVHSSILFAAEMMGIIIHFLCFLAMIMGFSVFVVFVLYVCEQMLRAAVFASAGSQGFTAKAAKASLKLSTISSRSLLLEGVTVTTANYSTRLPFITHSSAIDPIFVLAAQASSATYGLMIGLSSKFKLKVNANLNLATCLVLPVLFLACSAIEIPIVALIMQLIVLLILAFINGMQMTLVPGSDGFAGIPRARRNLVIGLIVAGGSGWAVSPIFFLFLPAVLACVAFIELRNGRIER